LGTPLRPGLQDDPQRWGERLLNFLSDNFIWRLLLYWIYFILYAFVFVPENMFKTIPAC